LSLKFEFTCQFQFVLRLRIPPNLNRKATRLSGPKRMSVRNGARIANNNFNRTLDAFEEHLIKEWHYSIPGLPRSNWRAVDGTDNGTIFGQYECLDCGMRHRLPGKGRALICKHLPAQEAKNRAVGYIELKIARARGQYEDVADLMLADLAHEIGYWRSWYSWGADVVGR
jgi:hypothetical protein